MEFIDRDIELSQLEKEYNRPGSSFVIYGRRRVGKTELIYEFIKNKDALYYLSTEEGDVANRRRLQEKMSSFSEILNNSDVFLGYTLFFFPSRKGKRIIVIDEFQYLAASNSSFLSVLQKNWDEKLKNENIMLIVCGSLIRMMWSQTLSATSPIYGRRTQTLRIHPIPFKFYKEFYDNELSDREAVELYSVTGGVPKYIEILRGYNDVYEAISERILDSSSILLDEPETILRREVAQIGTYFSILSAIAMGNEKLGDISSFLNIEKTNLSSPLAVLVGLDIIKRVVPITEENPERSKKGLYKIKDPYFRFWFAFIYQNLGDLNMGRKGYVLDKLKTNLIDNHTSYIYEDIARDKLSDLSDEGKLPFRFNRIGPWWDKDTEIDIVAYDSFGKDMLFGECKFKKEKMSRRVYDDLINKSQFVTWKKEIRREYFVLFSISGFDDELMQLAESKDNLLLYTI